MSSHTRTANNLLQNEYDSEQTVNSVAISQRKHTPRLCRNKGNKWDIFPETISDKRFPYSKSKIEIFSQNWKKIEI